MARALVFDSGVGGLSVVAQMRARLPALAIDYASDDAFRPYGDKTADQLRARLPGLVRTLADMAEADIVVIACNTASVTALSAIRAQSVVPVVGVVPAVKPAAEATRTGSLAVLGTPTTVRQDYVDALIADFAHDRDVLRIGSVALVDMAESKLSGGAVDPVAVRRELATLHARPDIDTVVLACTHFPLLRDELRGSAPSGITFIDSGEAIARRVESLLADQKANSTREDTAFLIGPAPTPARRQAFADFGFARVVGLHPA